VKYIIAATTMVNDLYFADGKVVKRLLGGGIYCIPGILPFCQDLGYVSACGPDFEDYYGDWFSANQLTTKGIRKDLSHTRYNAVEYLPDGQWREYSIYGNSYVLENEEKMMLRAKDLEVFCDSQTLGIYSESGVEEVYWNSELDKIREMAPNAKLLWEVPTYNITDPIQRKQVLPVAKKTDLWSINLPEGKELFGLNSETEVIDALKDFAIPCFFRVGEKGAYLIHDNQAVFAPAYEIDKSVDPTGCGNCSTAASLVGFTQGWDPLKTVCAANVTAAYTAKQTGPIAVINKEEIASVAMHFYQQMKR
jgi:sugar/nucleoside kinase (ribokinase family)